MVVSKAPQMEMMLYCSHSSKKAKRAAVENYAQRIPPEPVRVSKSTQERKA